MTLIRQVLRIRDGGSLADATPSSNKSLLFLEIKYICTFAGVSCVGKTPALCASDSVFAKTFEVCASCIEENESTIEDSTKDYVEPEFAQFIDYCSGIDATAVTSAPTVTTVTYLSTTWVAVVPETTSTTPCIICVPLTYTDGANIGVSQNPPTPIKVTKAKIIGLVVDEDPPQEEPKYETAQLHSDCISRGPTYELQGSVPLPPSPTTSPAVAEMTANEVAAQELPTSRQKALHENYQTGENELKLFIRRLSNLRPSASREIVGQATVMNCSAYSIVLINTLTKTPHDLVSPDLSIVLAQRPPNVLLWSFTSSVTVD
ncbi:hypothetical protein EDB81DRAFT_764792 [Dactylonectria macrodidyma]|uniref:Uncharacterized protein n=1 Tax=Dactylonectria macrodidyma TaxID=307937 RepID=A0A9P9DZ39_9HYPO|nr:hypothetical protein EDB81DRAFT_764792 [Dactylonectria macrodidyma]